MMKVYHLTQVPRPITVQLHDADCDCPACEPYRPSVPARLTGRQLAELTIAGVLLGHAVAAVAWGPATVVRVLWANLTGSAL